MNSRNAAKLRGTVIKVPDASPGLLFINGQQMQFLLQGVWKSSVAPATNMTVDVDLDSSGGISAITAVDPKEVAAQRPEEVLVMAKEQGARAINVLLPMLRSLTARMGAVPLGAAVLVWISWFFFTSARVNVGGGQVSFTFWNLLGIDFGNPENIATGDSHGLFSFLGLIAIAVPFVAPFLRLTWAKFLNAAPFATCVIGFIAIFANENRAFSGLSKAGLPSPFSWSFLIVLLFASTVVLGLGALRNDTSSIRPPTPGTAEQATWPPCA